ncbi:MAG: hypothetical protein IIV53_01205 [Bacteroidaceae bacterium]|nr:hypothetical protein [Bacteroidaceae bacterium]
MMKRYILTGILPFISISTSLCAEPSGRGYDSCAPDLGLPEGNEVLTGFIIAIIAIPIGYAILNAGKRDNTSDESLFPGCMGVILIGGGLVCLLPLVAWLFSILSAVLAIGFVSVDITGIIGLIFSKRNELYEKKKYHYSSLDSVDCFYDWYGVRCILLYQ